MDSFSIQNYFQRGKTVVLTLRQGDEEGARQWSDKDTNDLLKLMSAFLPEFRSPIKRKKDVWDDLSKEIQTSGYGWTPEDCRKKWSNMIRTFKGIEEQKLDPTSTSKRVKWPFYEEMKQLLTMEGSDEYPEARAVVMLMKSGTISSTSRSASSNLVRKTMTVFESVGGQRFSASQTHHHLLQDAHHTLQPAATVTSATTQQQHLVTQSLHPLHLVNETDVLGVTVTDSQEQLPSQVDVGPSTGLESQSDSPIFTDYATPSSQPTATSSTANYSASFRSKPYMAFPRGKKMHSKQKSGKQIKKSPEECMDDLFLKFMETTQKQNNQLLDKMTTFQDNALAMMHERNGLLRELRDTLQENRMTMGNDSNLAQSCHDGLDNAEADTLTLHLGPAYSTNPNVTGNTSESGDVNAQINPALVMSDSTAAATTLSSFQLVEDSSVLSGIDTAGEKGVLPNLEPFTESVIPEVFHPTLVSVMPSRNDEDPSTAITLSLPSSSLKRKLDREN